MDDVHIIIFWNFPPTPLWFLPKYTNQLVIHADDDLWSYDVFLFNIDFMNFFQSFQRAIQFHNASLQLDTGVSFFYFLPFFSSSFLIFKISFNSAFQNNEIRNVVLSKRTSLIDITSSFGCQRKIWPYRFGQVLFHFARPEETMRRRIFSSLIRS